MSTSPDPQDPIGSGATAAEDDVRSLISLQGITLSVLRDADGFDTTLGGISGRFRQLTLVGVRYEHERRPVELLPAHVRVSAPTPERPAVLLNVRRFGHRPDGVTLNIQPYHVDAIQPWYMAGGNYAHTSDSRVSDLCEALTGHRWYAALSIHDRNEA